MCSLPACLQWILSTAFPSRVSVGVRPRPCRARHTPSLTRAPLLSPDAAGAKRGLGHVRPFIIHDRWAARGGRRDLGWMYTLSSCYLFLKSARFSVTAVCCLLCREKPTSSLCLHSGVGTHGASSASLEAKQMMMMMDAANTVSGMLSGFACLWFVTTVILYASWRNKTFSWEILGSSNQWGGLVCTVQHKSSDKRGIQ